MGMDEWSKDIVSRGLSFVYNGNLTFSLHHNEHSSFYCLADWSACQSTQESDSQGQEPKID
jgi:hypothetical protein